MDNKAYPNIKHAALLCLLFLGIQIAGGLIFGVIIGLLGYSSESLIFGLGTILFFIISFVTVILIGFKKSGKKFNEVFLFKNVPFGIWLSVIIFMFGYVVISSGIDNLLNYFLPMPVFLQNTFQLMLSNDYFIISVLLVGILPAFLEEMFFRGVVLTGFIENYSQTKAILFSALFFGLIHLNPYQFVTAFLMGLVMAYVLIKTNSILPAIYMHLFNNMLAVFVMRINGPFIIEGFNSSYGDHSFQPWWFNLIGIILAGAGAWLFFKQIKKSEPAQEPVQEAAETSDSAE